MRSICGRPTASLPLVSIHANSCNHVSQNVQTGDDREVWKAKMSSAHRPVNMPWSHSWPKRSPSALHVPSGAPSLGCALCALYSAPRRSFLHILFPHPPASCDVCIPSTSCDARIPFRVVMLALTSASCDACSPSHRPVVSCQTAFAIPSTSCDARIPFRVVMLAFLPHRPVCKL